MKLSCNKINNSQLDELGYNSNVSYYIKSEDKIIISSCDIQTIKHENCHRIQNLNGRLEGNCDKPFGIVLNEMECYIAQDLPNWFYRIFY